MRVEIDVLLPDDRKVTVGHGAIVGRLATADVHLPDPRVSEAHGLFSLRGRDVRFLALRGRFAVDGRPSTDVTVREGMTLHLADGLALRVLEVRLPERLLGLRVDGLGLVVPSGVTSLICSPTPRLVNGWTSEADATIWPVVGGWMRSGEPPQAIGFGDAWQVRDLRICAEAVGAVASAETDAGTGFVPPVTLELFFDTVHLKRVGHDVLVIRGTSARILSDVALAQAPMPWLDLAREIWGSEDPSVLRRRWDTQMYRLRRVLRRSGFPPGLLQADGTGLVEVVLRSQDVVVDRT